jgi:NAD(P) transhydrogenase subunit alpha
MNKVGILKEKNGDLRVCIIPKMAARIQKELSYEVSVETGAGLGAGFSDQDYEQEGLQIMQREKLIHESDTLLCINDPQLDKIEDSKTVIAILNPLFLYRSYEKYLSKAITIYSLDLLPRTTKAQAMDVLSSMASLAGYQAVLKAADVANLVIPMFTTAAGTIKPARVLIIGAGVAGLQAIATAKRLGAVVDVFDVRKSAGEEVRSLGANFIEVEGSIEDKNAGGYAVEQSEAYLNRQRELIDQAVTNASIIVTTANIPGKKAPVLIFKSSVEKMKAGSVIIDLAAEQGGNCELTKNYECIEFKGVKIIGNSHLSAELASTASQLLSTNFFNFIKHLKTIKRDGINTDTIVEDCLFLEEGTLRNARVKSNFQQV